MEQNRKKFTKLYDKNIKKIYRYIFLKTGAVETAEDLASQVFIKGWKKLQTGQKIGNMPAYLFQIARTEIADFYRKKSKYQIISTEAVAEPSELPNLEEEQQFKWEARQAKALLGQLKEDYQDVLILRYIDGYDVKKVALMLNKTEGNTRVLLHRALQSLKEKLG